MRETALREKLALRLGYPYVLAWSDTVALAGVDHRTVTQALEAGVPCAAIWQAACDVLDIPARDR